MKSTSPFRAGLVALALAAATLSGCASPALRASNAEVTVYAAKSAYAAALKTAVAYKKLPACATPAVPPCSNPALVAQLQKADNATAAALDAAEAAVRSPALDRQAKVDAVSAAQAALTFFTTLTKQIGAPR